MKSDEGEREEMGPIERSEAFWDTFGTVTSESKVDKSDNSKSDVYTSVEGTGGNVDDNDDEEDDNDQSSKRSKRRRGRVYSRFGRMEIWDCSILGCESRLRRCSVIAELDFFPLFFANSIFLSLRSRFDERTYVRMRIHIRVSSFFILFSLSLSFPLPSLDLPQFSVYDATNEGIFNPANHQRGIEPRAQATSRTWSSSSSSSSSSTLVTSRDYLRNELNLFHCFIDLFFPLINGFQKLWYKRGSNPANCPIQLNAFYSTCFGWWIFSKLNYIILNFT